MLTSFEIRNIPKVSFIGNTACPKDWCVPSYTHSMYDYELVFIYQGEAVFNIENSEYRVYPGESMLLTYSSHISSRTVPENPCKFYFVRFTLEADVEKIEESGLRQQIINTIREANSQEIHNFFIMPQTNFKRVYIPHKIQLGTYKEKIYTIFEKALAERQHLTLNSELIIASYIIQLLVMLSRITIESLNLQTFIYTEGGIPRIIQEAIFYIHENYTKKLEVNDICRYFDISPQHMIRLFKKSLGMTPLQYINQLRITRAKDLFRNTFISVKEAAYALGFENPFHFSSLFKKMEGISPSEFKRDIEKTGSLIDCFHQ